MKFGQTNGRKLHNCMAFKLKWKFTKDFFFFSKMGRKRNARDPGPLQLSYVYVLYHAGKWMNKKSLNSMFTAKSQLLDGCARGLICTSTHLRTHTHNKLSMHVYFKFHLLAVDETGVRHIRLFLSLSLSVVHKLQFYFEIKM